MKNNFYILFALSLVFVLPHCKNKGTAADEQDSQSSLIHITKGQFNQMNMEVGTLQEVEFNHEVEMRGIADVPPQSKAMVSPAISGSVKNIFVRIGDRIRKGQPLFSIEGTEIIALQQSYLEICEQLKSLESEYQRQKMLFDENISSQKLYLEAESNYKKTNAVSEGLRQQLIMLNIDVEKVKQGKIFPSAVIYSPIAGDVIKINADISRHIQISDIVVEIVDTRQLQLYLSVFEKNILLIKKGQKVTFTIPESSNLEFFATVKNIGKAIDQSNYTAVVEATPDENARKVLLTGMYIDAHIIIDTKKVFAVQSNALIFDNEETFVLLLQSSDNDEYIFKKVKVQTRERYGDFLEIIPDEEVTQSSNILIKGTYHAI
ncbi:MAG: efflux RND transporter periplasmic adaptor subunit [Paludibacter sp.]|nr:efflux RND transporter periplasmic adaptor subunit [Paludibacter sp.]